MEELGLRRCAQLLLQTLRQPDDLLLVGLDDEVRGLAVQRIAKRVDLLQPFKRIGTLQQWPMLAAPGSLPQRRRSCMQVEYRSVLLQAVAVYLAQHCAAAGREYRVGVQHVLGDDRLLAIAESGLAFQFEDHRNRHAE